MNEIEAKLNSRNPVLVGQVIFRLVEAIRKNYKNDLQQVPEYKYLSEKCLSKFNDINVVASKAIVYLVELNILPLKNVMNDFISKIYGSGDLSGVIHVVYQLIIIERQRTPEVSYNLATSCHPLVQILERDSSYAEVILNHLKIVHRNPNLSKYKLFHPVYLYIFNEPKVADLTKQRLWSLLLEHENSERITYILRWMQVPSRETNEFLQQYMMQVCKTETDGVEALILYGIAVLEESLESNQNPSELISCIARILAKNKLTVGQNCVLYLLAGCIEKSPLVYLEELLSLSLTVYGFGNINRLILQNLKTSVLPWLLYPCFLTESTTKLADKILNLKAADTTIQSTRLLFSNTAFSNLKNSASNLMLSSSICSLCEGWKDTNEIVKWLEELEQTPDTFQKALFQFLLALFMEYFAFPHVSVKCLHLLVQSVRTYKYSANNLLILLLYKLPTTTNSTLHFEILKALPKLAVKEENVVLVRLTVESLGKGSLSLQTFAMSLMFEMWRDDNRFYGHLERVLAEPQDVPDWEYYVAKSYILKEICSIRPELYGKDAVPHLSKILNECTSPASEAPCALAIEGIKHLCRSGVVDLITTWNTLSVLYKNETRPLVIQSLCELLEEAPLLPPSKNETHYRFTEEVVTKLWEFVTMSDRVEVIASALKTLSCFSLEDISRCLPDVYRVGEKTSDDLLFEKAPGLCWIKFLENGNYAAMKEMGDFLASLVKLEIASYTKITYTVTQQQREPQNYSYLPQHSVVRAIGTYLQNGIGKWKGAHELVYLECLRVFSKEYSKPLPPFTWSFLQELVHEPEARQFCLTIACHQVMLSGTARRFIENFLMALTEVCTNDEDILVIYRNLKHLCNSVQPVILKPFLEKSVEYILNWESRETFTEIVQNLREILTSDRIQESNKKVIAELISNNLERVYSKNDAVFSDYLSCVLHLSQNEIESLSSPKMYKQISLEQFRMCVKIRCAAVAEVMSKVPLDLIKELFYVVDEEKKKYILLEEITALLKNQKNKVVNSTWITDLLGQIQTTIAEEEKFSPHLQIFFEVLILSVVIFAGYNVFVKRFDPEKLRFLFPATLSAIVKTTYFNHQTMQILEWLHYIVRLEFLPEHYRVMALESLINLRDETDFRRNSRWKKYVGNDFLLNRQ